MRCILTLLICLTYLNVNSNVSKVTGKKLSSIVSYNIEGKELQYKKYYNSIIEQLKKQEGFRANIYDDGGFECCGYGQRIKFYPHQITTPLTKLQAEDILKDSFNNHLKGVKKLYPKINKLKALRLAKISYQSGIIKVIKLIKYENNKV